MDSTENGLNDNTGNTGNDNDNSNGNDNGNSNGNGNGNNGSTDSDSCHRKIPMAVLYGGWPGTCTKIDDHMVCTFASYCSPEDAPTITEGSISESDLDSHAALHAAMYDNLGNDSDSRKRR